MICINSPEATDAAIAFKFIFRSIKKEKKKKFKKKEQFSRKISALQTQEMYV